MDFMAVRAHNGHINCGKSRTTRYSERDDGPGYYKPAGSIQDVVAEFLSYLHSQDFFTNKFIQKTIHVKFVTLYIF